MSTLPKTLPACRYTDPEFFRRESDAFFFDGWICAGRAETIPNSGDYFLREVVGESIILGGSLFSAVLGWILFKRYRTLRVC